MEPSPELTLTIGSRFDDLELVDRLIEEVAGQRRLPDRKVADLSLATREAVANAVHHGNGLDPGKSVVVRVLLEPEDLLVVVADEGTGFDPDALPDPLDPANILKPSGRGIFLMRKLMDDVTFDFPDVGGTVVTMRMRTSVD
jgi:serine/threonine-protein kinase RsbW